MTRIHVTKYDESRDCGCCLWSNHIFYRIGEDPIDPWGNEEDRARFGKGLCADCFAEMLHEEGCTIVWAGDAPTEVEHVN